MEPRDRELQLQQQKARLEKFRSGAGGLIALAERTHRALEQYRDLNQQMLKAFQRRNSLWIFLASFLLKQNEHMKSIIVLQKEERIDCILVARSMLEGAAQMRYVLSSSDPKALADKWARYRFNEAKPFWHGLKTKDLIARLEESLPEILQREFTVPFVMGWFKNFSAYHHWDHVPFPFPKSARDSFDELSMAFGFLCLRYAIRECNDTYSLQLDADLKAFQ